MVILPLTGFLDNSFTLIFVKTHYQGEEHEKHGGKGPVYVNRFYSKYKQSPGYEQRLIL